MSIPRRSIHTLAKSVWDQDHLKNRFDRQIWASAEAIDCVAAPEPLADATGVCPARIHADFNRMTHGRAPHFPETTSALVNIRAELDRLGFVATPDNRYVFSEELNICGEMDALGLVDGHMPTIVELKVVRWLPQIVRAADTAQLVMYELARTGCTGRTMLVAVYVQPTGQFRAATRIVFDPEKLEPLVRELAA